MLREMEYPVRRSFAIPSLTPRNTGSPPWRGRRIVWCVRIQRIAIDSVFKQRRRVPAPSPRLRGEGRGEGDSPHVLTRGESPSPEAFGFDLSPQAGRGDERGCSARANADSIFKQPSGIGSARGSPSPQRSPTRGEGARCRRRKFSIQFSNSGAALLLPRPACGERVGVRGTLPTF
jgi:hypothetical protein